MSFLGLLPKYCGVGQKTEIRVSAGLAPFQRLCGRILPASSSFGGRLASLAGRCITLTSLSSRGHLPCVRVSVSKCPSSYKDNGQPAFRATLILLSSSLDHICKDLVSQKGHVHKHWRLGLERIFWGDPSHNSASQSAIC